MNEFVIEFGVYYILFIFFLFILFVCERSVLFHFNCFVFILFLDFSIEINGFVIEFGV